MCRSFKVGQRVGLGWHGGHCNYCAPCRRGDFILCENQLVSGIDFDGGYADYVIAPANALALMAPEHRRCRCSARCCARALRPSTALRNSGARPGDTVAIPGHRRPGAPRRAVRGQERIPHGRDCARAGQGSAGQATGRACLHRQHNSQDPAKELKKLGGASGDSCRR